MEERLLKANPYFKEIYKEKAPYIIEILDTLAKDKKFTINEAKSVLNECCRTIDSICLFD